MARTIDEWLADPHAMESGAVVLRDDPVYGPMKQVGLQVRMSATPGAIRGPAPALGQHTGEVLAGLPVAS